MKHPYDSRTWPKEIRRANTVDIVLWIAGLILFAAFMIGWSHYTDEHMQLDSGTTCQMVTASQGFCHE